MKYKKINGYWYRTKCIECDTWLKNIYSKRCKRCWLETKKGYRPQNLIDIGFYKKDWHGTDSEYVLLHNWARAQLAGITECQNCGSINNLHCANKSHNYMKVVDDWIKLCSKCHKAYDLGRLEVI